MAGPCFSSATATRSSVSEARVGIVSWDYGENAKGGLGYAMAEMVGVLRGHGIAVEVLAPSRRSSFLVPRSSFVVSVGCFLQQWIDTHRIQAVILPTGPGGLFLWKKPKRCRVIVVCYHTYFQQARMVPGQWWKRAFVLMERWTLALADRVLCYSPDTERVLLEWYSVHRTKLTLLPQLLDLDAWCPSLTAKEPGLCIFVGRLDRRKGIDVLLRAWPRVVGTVPFAHLVIVGDGRGRTRVRDFVAHHSSVQWMSSLSQEELIRLVQRAELAICPSYLEGFGLACAEAMAAGTAVVASDCDGLRSLVQHEETGWLVPPGDPLALSDGVATLFRDAALRERLAERAQEYMRRFFNQEEATRRFLLDVVYSSRA